MTRKTSIDTYHEIKESGLLSKIRLKVLENIAELAPCTSTELEKHMNEKHNMRGSWKVLSYLRDTGVLCETGIRKCKVTGREVIEWKMTGNMPDKSLLQKKSKPKNLKKCVEYIISKIDDQGLIFVDKSTLLKITKES